MYSTSKSCCEFRSKNLGLEKDVIGDVLNLRTKKSICFKKHNHHSFYQKFGTDQYLSYLLSCY
jgi:hypothetical protein